MKKKTIKKMALLLGTAVLMTTAIVGCSKEEGSKAVTTENTDPFGKYEEPVTITVASREWGNVESNVESLWGQKYKEYGINVEIAWSAAASQYEDKLNTVIASGDVPDIFQVIGADPMNTLARADMVADLSEVFETYASPLVKERFSTEAGKKALEAATFDGKLCYIPLNVYEPMNSIKMMYIRKDWLDNLGLEIPTTIEEVKEAAIAFAKQDPDKNGINDTYGITVTGKDAMKNLTGFFAGYNINPSNGYDGMIFYSEDENGQVIWDGEKEEMKTALQDLQDLYAEGAIVKDFATYDKTRATEDLNGGKAGICFEQTGAPTFLFNNTYASNQEAEWYALKMPSMDENTDSYVRAFQPLNTGYAVSAEYPNPEVAIRMLNLVTEMSNPESEMYNAEYTLENRTISGDSYMLAVPDPEVYRKRTEKIKQAFETKSIEGLNDMEAEIYNDILKFEETGDASAWINWNSYYPAEGHVYHMVYSEYQDMEIKDNLWQKLPTREMSAKLSVWKKMFDESLVNIISGSDVASWDKALGEWAKLGGDEIKQTIAEEIK